MTKKLKKEMKKSFIIYKEKIAEDYDYQPKKRHHHC